MSSSEQLAILKQYGPGSCGGVVILHLDAETEGDYVDDDAFDYDSGEYCDLCDEFGMYVICPDDMCHGGQGCIHGDGEVICPYCKGKGKF